MRVLCLLTTLATLLAAPAFANADRLLICEDRDNDGRFGLVELTLTPAARDAEVMQANLGTYQTCTAAIAQQGACNGSALCACEDRDRDGRFGIVRHPYPTTGPTVLEANTGNYFTCRDRLAAYPARNDRYLTCEDYDNDGRFGVVSHALVVQTPTASVIQPNIGNYYACTQQAASTAQCQGNAYCGCVDADGDGRFGIVRVPSRLASSRVTQPNIGAYGACFSNMNWPDWVD